MNWGTRSPSQRPLPAVIVSHGYDGSSYVLRHANTPLCIELMREREKVAALRQLAAVLVVLNLFYVFLGVVL